MSEPGRLHEPVSSTHSYTPTRFRSVSKRGRVSATTSEATPFPTRVAYDRASGALMVVVDAHPATIDDVAVAACSSRLRIRIEHDGSVYDRTVSPPVQGRTFTDDREAVYNNGVLSVTVGTARASSRRR